MPFQSRDTRILGQQLLVQEVSIRFSDAGLYSQSGSTVTVDVGEALSAIVAVQHDDDSGPTCVLVAHASCTFVGSVMTIVLASALAANDVLRIQYITAE